MLKVLMVVPSIEGDKNLAGTPSHVIKLTQNLNAKGLDVKIFESRRRSKQIHKMVTYSSTSWSLAYQLPLTIFRFRPDIIHSHTHAAALPVIFFATFFKIIHICECHGVPRRSETKPLRSSLLNSLESLVLNHCDGLITQAIAMKIFLQNKIKNKSIPLLVAYPGLNIKEFSEYSGPSLMDLNIPINKKIVMYIGTSLCYQGLDLLAASQEYLHNSDVHFVLYLSDKSTSTVLKSLAFKPEMTSIVDLEDSSKLPALMKAATVLVHTRPNTIDNLNVQSKLGLYLASGKPIVTTNVGDYVDILTDSGVAVLSSTEPNKIAEAIMQAIFDDNIAIRAQINGPILAKKYFDINENSKNLCQFYNQLLI